MSLRDKATAIWLAWKWVLILAGMLALSLYGNYRQFRHAIEAPLKQENKALSDALGIVNGVAKEAKTDNRILLEDLGILVDRGRTERVVYGKAATATPLAPNCAPGKARVDAINQILGPNP